ncbi:MAG: hypothetical protein M1835_003602 [Candelina submexicana]|nr:MAG: hypothetical protein M1835_003602 [Candelina submexicana]
MSKVAISTNEAPAPLPYFSQAINCNGMVYCSGAIGQDKSGALIEGSVGDRTRQALRNLSAVLKAAGSDIQNCVQVRVFLTTMENFVAMNKAYDEVFEEPKPVG